MTPSSKTRGRQGHTSGTVIKEAPVHNGGHQVDLVAHGRNKRSEALSILFHDPSTDDVAVKTPFRLPVGPDVTEFDGRLNPAPG